MDALEAPRTVLRVTARLYQRISAQIILLTAFLGLVYFLVYFLLNSSLAGRIFDTAVNSQFRGQISWTRINWGPLPWKIDILGVVLAGPDGRPVITADRVRVDQIHLLDLIGGRIAAEEVTVERPVVTFKARPHPAGADEYGNPGNLMNIAEMFLPPAGKIVIDEGDAAGDTQLAFDNVTIKDARFVLDQPEILIEVDGANVTGSRFGVDPSKGSDAMTIGAVGVDFTRARVSIAAGELKTPVIHAGPDEALSWTLSGGALRNFNWKGEAFTVQSITGSVRGDPLKIRGFRMDLGQPGVPAMRARIELAAADLATHLRPLGVHDISGPATLIARGDGQLDSIAATASVEGARLVAFGHTLTDWALAANLSPDGVGVIESLEARALGGRIYTTARYDIERGDAEAQVELKGIDPAQVPALSGIREVRRLARGPLDLRLRAHAAAITSPERRASVTLDAEHFRMGGELPGVSRTTEINLIAALDGGALTVHRLHLDAGPDQVRVLGGLTLDDTRGRLSGTVRLPNLGDIAAALDVPAAGAFEADFEVRGKLTDPTAEVRIAGTNLRYADYPSATLAAKLRYASMGVQVDALDLQSEIGDVTASGALGFARGTIDMQVGLRDLDLAAVPVDLDVAGIVGTSRQIRIHGALGNPQIDGAISVKDPRYQRLSLKSIVVDGAWTGQTAELRALTIEGLDAMRVTAAGTVNLRRKRFKGRLNAADVPISLANAFVQQPLGVDGTLGLEVDGEGPFDNPTGKATLSIGALGYETWKMKASSLTFTAKDSIVDVDGKLFELLEIEGRVPLVPNQGLGHVQVAFADLSPARLGLNDKRFDARATGRIMAHFDAPHGRLDSVDATFETLRADYNVFDIRGRVIRTPLLDGPDMPTLRVEAQRPVRLSFRDGIAALDDVALQVNTQPIRLVGTAGADGSLDVALRTALDLSLAAPFLAATANDISGDLAVSVDVIGPAADPNISGWVRLNRLDMVPRSSVIGRDIHLEEPVEFALTSPIGPKPMEGGKPIPGVFTVTLPPETRPRPGEPARANRFRLRRDEANIDITQVDVDFERFGLERLYLTMNAQDLALNVPKVVRGIFDATGLSVELFQHRESGRPPETRLKVGGDIAIEDAEYSADIVSTSAINQNVTDNLRGRSRARSVSVFERVPLLKRLILDVHLHGDESIRVRSNLAVIQTDLELKLDLTAKGFLIGKPSDPAEDQLQLTGTVDILDDTSTITYQRRTFDVNEGVVNLGGQNFMSANINASTTFQLRTDSGQSATAFDRGAGSSVREEEVTLELDVVMPTRDSDPKINPTLTSSSGASKIEVLTLLLTGRYPSDLTGAASAAPATEVLLGPVLSLIERPLEETLDLNLSLTPDAAGTLFIDADKVLSRRLRLYSRTPVGTDAATNPQIFGLEYRINNGLTSELSTEQLGNTNATSGRLRLRLEWD